MHKSTTHIIGQVRLSSGPNQNGDIFPNPKVELTEPSDSTVLAIAEGIATELKNRYDHINFSVRRDAVVSNITVYNDSKVEANAACIKASMLSKTLFEIRLFKTIVLTIPLAIPSSNMWAEVNRAEFEFAHPQTLERLYAACHEVLATTAR